MAKLELNDLLNIYDYEKKRDEIRRDIIDYKRQRRFQLGPEIVLTFENRRTMFFQVQEMMRAERMVKDEQIQEELDIYNELLPQANELSATLFIEITQDEKIKEMLQKFLGMTSGESVYIQVGDTRIPAVFEEGREEEDKISSVHYVVFPMSADQKAQFMDEGLEAQVVIDYKDYQYTIAVTAKSRKSLMEDLH